MTFHSYSLLGTVSNCPFVEHESAQKESWEKTAITEHLGRAEIIFLFLTSI